MYKTDTFTLGEREKTNERAFGGGFVSQEIYYCSYCGKKATLKDVGYSHNHRWEEEIIHFCDCEDAKTELMIKEKIAKLEREVFVEKSKLKDLAEKKNNKIVNKMKFENEVKKLKEKYKI